MSITITDPAQLAFLAELTRAAEAEVNKLVEIRDPSGWMIGRFQIDWEGKLPPGFTIPFTEEELAERRKDRTGRPLADILRDLRERGEK